MKQAFDAIADEYDSWYDTPEGDAVFQSEVKCLRLLHEGSHGRWLEVGVGTGRFACSLGIPEGIDPSPRMLEIAAGRGIAVYQGSAESLPFGKDSYNGVLMALALCFAGDAQQALKECHRVLSPRGCLLLGIVPVDSPWGRAYVKKALKGHPVYVLAHFRTVAEITGLAQGAGFTVLDAASTLFWNPGEARQAKPRVERGVVSKAGFVGSLFEKEV